MRLSPPSEMICRMVMEMRQFRWLVALCCLFAASCAHPRVYPKYEAELAKYDLVDLRDYDPTLVIDLRYKTSQNGAHQPVYPQDFPPLLRTQTAAKLKKVNLELKKAGLRLIVWDAYRPHECQIRLWTLCGSKSSHYLANPYQAPSLHSHGSAIDLGLCRLDGSAVAMPTDFDDFRPEAGSNFPCADPEAAANLLKLKYAIWNHGMGTLPTEWWHFMDQNWERIPYVNLGFEQIAQIQKLRD